MVVRLSAAICGALMVVICSSAAMARSEIRAVHSYDPDGAAIVGAASMYNPYHPGYREGGKETSSGEHYDPSAWAAAIQTDLRERFGGVRRDKRTSYAMVEALNKKAIVKINDVGPLKPGRIIDFDERTMRYFDPTLRLGLIHSVKVTPLHGDDWVPGPIAERSPQSEASVVPSPAPHPAARRDRRG
jgi:rare lipoprotein A